MNTKKVLGYGYRLNSESWTMALSFYTDKFPFHKSEKGLSEQIKRDRDNGNIPRGCRPKIFRIILETGK